MENSHNIEEQLFEYIRKASLNHSKPITRDTLLFREGIFDSMGFVLLIDFIEEKFGVKALDEDLIEENFESVSAMMGYLQKRLKVLTA